MQKLKQIYIKISTWIKDRYHLLFKSAALNHLRIQQLAQNQDGTYQLTVRFGSYTELKNYQRKLRRVTVSLSTAVAMMIVAFVVSPYILNPHRSAASGFSWGQITWNGHNADPTIVDNSTAVHPTNDSGWTTYTQGNGVTTTAANTVVLKNPTPATTGEAGTVDSSHVAFNYSVSGVYRADATTGNYSATGTMLAPKKPNGASCSGNNTECISAACISNLCLAACDATAAPGTTCAFGGIAYGFVTGPDGKVWMDRNLGATSTSNSSTGYGWYFQWGRAADGHQISTSGTTSTLSSVDNPYPSGGGLFIMSSTDWRSPANANLWQGVNGTNNPCPPGFRLPILTEWQNVLTGVTNATAAYNTTLKLTSAGLRSNTSPASVSSTGFGGYYWAGASNNGVLFDSSRTMTVTNDPNAFGKSVRCIKN